jgi:ribosomal protein L11 methyltransferase
MERIQLNVFLNVLAPWTDILIAELSDLGFDSFVETETGLEAYANEQDVKESDLSSISIFKDKVEGLEVHYTIEKIPFQNWNALWEADFKPVFVEDKVTIIAPFHDSSIVVGLPIIIQPQMSFGTGHHQTTWMMTKAMMEIPNFPKRVLDMGTGTGVLAILAEKLGAESILAIDIESWSVENTIENATRNNCKLIDAYCGDIDLVYGKEFDIILANINKNVLKSQFSTYASTLVLGGTLIISGFFESDVEELKSVAIANGLKFVKVFTKETWAAVQFEK